MRQCEVDHYTELRSGSVVVVYSVKDGSTGGSGSDGGGDGSSG